jgi:hypothetical protein
MIFRSHSDGHGEVLYLHRTVKEWDIIDTMNSMTPALTVYSGQGPFSRNNVQKKTCE